MICMFLSESMGVIHNLPSVAPESMQKHQQSVTPPSGIYENSKMRVMDIDMNAALKAVEKNNDGHYLCSECKKSFTRLDSFKQVSISCPSRMLLCIIFT